MNRKDKLFMLKKLEYYVKKQNKLVDSMIKHGYAIESNPIEEIHNLGNAFIFVVKKVLGDENTLWIDWHIYDNDFGKNKLEAGYDKKLKPICNWDDVLDLIEEGNKRK